MKYTDLIPANDFCLYHHVDYAFIQSLQDAELISVTVIDQTSFIPLEETQKLERLLNLHELDINVAGLEAISHLLSRIEQMQDDMRCLQNKLRLYGA